MAPKKYLRDNKRAHDVPETNGRRQWTRWSKSSLPKWPTLRLSPLPRTWSDTRPHAICSTSLRDAESAAIAPRSKLPSGNDKMETVPAVPTPLQLETWAAIATDDCFFS